MGVGFSTEPVGPEGQDELKDFRGLGGPDRLRPEGLEEVRKHRVLGS